VDPMTVSCPVVPAPAFVELVEALPLITVDGPFPHAATAAATTTTVSSRLTTL
jgi:hypothetical protein